MPVALTSLAWYPEKLTLRLKAAFPEAARETQAIAQGLNPAKRHIRVVLDSLNTSYGYVFLRGRGGLAHIFEGGRAGGYPIQPGLRTVRNSRRGTVRIGTSSTRGSQVAIKFTRGDGGFYRGPGFMGGPMRARPFIHPAAAMFPTLYRQRAVMAFRLG